MGRRFSVIAVFVLIAFACVAVSAVTIDATPAAAAKKKKCKKGYKRVGKKCKRNPQVIKPTKIVLVVGKLRDGKFGATGYAEFPKTSRNAVLKGFWHISNGIGYERLKVSWNVAKGVTYSNFTDTERKVGLTGTDMTATLVIQGVQSNAQPLIK